ncbi:MAG: KdsC family phosphatase [Fidelibacterota bacterium]
MSENIKGYNKNLNPERIKKIKMILTDVDGVLTDGSLMLGDGELELKSFNVHDGFAIYLAKRAGLKVGFITGRTSRAVERRAKELGIDVLYQGELNKRIPYEKVKSEYELDDDEIAFIGDDFLDLVILKKVGFSASVANAREEVKRHVHYVTSAKGGDGAFREIIDLILKEKGLWEDVTGSF